MRVREVMTSPVSTLQARTPLQPAAALLVAQGFTGAPVVDGDGPLVDVMTEGGCGDGTGMSEHRGPKGAMARFRSKEHCAWRIGASATQPRIPSPGGSPYPSRPQLRPCIPGSTVDVARMGDRCPPLRRPTWRARSAAG